MFGRPYPSYERNLERVERRNLERRRRSRSSGEELESASSSSESEKERRDRQESARASHQQRRRSSSSREGRRINKHRSPSVQARTQPQGPQREQQMPHISEEERTNLFNMARATGLSATQIQEMQNLIGQNHSYEDIFNYISGISEQNRRAIYESGRPVEPVPFIPPPNRAPENPDQALRQALEAARLQEQAAIQARQFQESKQQAEREAQEVARAQREAQARGQARAAQPQPTPDPSVPSQRRDIDPERARATAEIMERARELSLRPPLPMPDLQRRFAFPGPEEQEAANLARQHGSQTPYYQRAQALAELSQRMMPQGVHHYMNPYQHHVVNRIAEEGNRNLFENILPGLEARYIKLGQHGGRRHHDLGARAIRDVQREISAQQAQALASGYENAAHNFNLDMARQLESSRMNAFLGQQTQASRLADIAALREAESESRAFRQGLKDFEQHELQRVYKHPEEMLNFYSQMAAGQPYSTTTQTYTPSPPQSIHRRGYQNAMMNFLGNMAGNLV